MRTKIDKLIGTILITIAILCSLFVAQMADAKVYIEMTGFPGYSNQNTQETPNAGGSTDGVALNNNSGFSYDLRTTVGYVFNDQFLVGFNYNYANSPTSATATASSASLDNFTKFREYGVCAGYFLGKFRVIGSYLWGGVMNYQDKEIQADGTPLVNYAYQNNGGTGYQLIAGYDIPITKNIKIGPTFVYRKITYTSQSKSDSVGGSGYPNTSFTTKATFSSVTPMVSLMLEFGGGKANHSKGEE